MTPPVRILYVDDNPLDRELVRDALEKEHGGFQVTEAASRAAFEVCLAEGDYDLVLSDFNILGFEGLQVLEAVRAKDPRLPVVIVTGTGSEEIAVEAMKQGAADYVIKTPRHIQRLPHTIQTVLEKQRLLEERKRAEEATQESAQRLQMAARAANVGLWDWDLCTNRVFYSSEWKRQIGYEDHEISNDFSEWQSRVHPDDLDRSLQTVRAFIEKPWPDYQLEFRFRHKNGSYHWILAQASLLHDEQGKPIRMLGSHVDVTERKRAEEALRESENRFRELFNNMSSGVAVYEARSDGQDFVFRDFNRAAERIESTPREAVLGRSVAEVFPGVKELGLFDVFQRVWRTGQPEHHPAGIYRDNRIAGWRENYVYKLPSGEIVAVYDDVTDRKRAEEGLAESEKHYHSLFENMLDGFAYCRMLFEDNRPQDFIYLTVNSAFEKLTGLKNVVGRRVTEAIPGIRESHPELFETYGRVALGGPPERFELYFKPLESWLSISVYSTEKEQFAAVFDNITERKRAEEALRVRTQQLEAVRVITTEITRELDLTTLLELIIRRAVELLGATSGTVRLWDEEAQLLIPGAWHGLGDWAKGQSRRLGEALSGTVALRREGLMVNDYPRSAYANPAILKHVQINAVLGEPLIYRDRLLGTLTTDKHAPGSSFTEGDQELFRLFTAQAAIAIENARLFGEVRAQHRQLRRLTARLAEAEEMERQRLARELHDQVGQNLTALNLNLNILRSQLPADLATNLAARMTDSMKLVEETVAHIRGVMADLRPPVLDDYGLMAALRWYGEQFSTRTGVAVSVRGEELTPRLPQPVETALFRITQEALTNVAKHAAATQVNITLPEEAGEVRLTIADNGVGMAPLAERTGSAGWGLLTMRERAEAVGGSLNVESAPGEGTRVMVEIGRQ